jgi:hypothetical protein
MIATAPFAVVGNGHLVAVHGVTLVVTCSWYLHRPAGYVRRQPDPGVGTMMGQAGNDDGN